jgi:hypothetical protein
MQLRRVFYALLIGIPGGCLIFMAMLMFNALLGMFLPTGPWTMLVFLCLTSLLVGMLARLMQPYHGLGAAFASGSIAALIILILQSDPNSNTGMRLVLGPAGLLVTIGFCVLGACILPWLKKRP